MNKHHRNLLLAGALGLAGGLVATRLMTRSRGAPGAREGELPTAGVLDTLALAVDVLAPTFAKGVIIRKKTA